MSLSSRVLRLRVNMLDRLGDFLGPVVAYAAETTGYSRGASIATPSERKSSERSRWSRLLHELVDGATLQGAELASASSAWIDDGSLLLSGRDFVRAVKCRGNLLYTRARAARDM